MKQELGIGFGHGAGDSVAGALGFAAAWARALESATPWAIPLQIAPFALESATPWAIPLH